METKTYTADMHIKETEDSQPNNRVFECWLEGGHNIFSVPTHQNMLTSSQAIAWIAEVERQAYVYGIAEHFNENGDPVQCNVVVNRIQELRF